MSTTVRAFGRAVRDLPRFRDVCCLLLLETILLPLMVGWWVLLFALAGWAWLIAAVGRAELRTGRR